MERGCQHRAIAPVALCPGFRSRFAKRTTAGQILQGCSRTRTTLGAGTRCPLKWSPDRRQASEQSETLAGCAPSRFRQCGASGQFAPYSFYPTFDRDFDSFMHFAMNANQPIIDSNRLQCRTLQAQKCEREKCQFWTAMCPRLCPQY